MSTRQLVVRTGRLAFPERMAQMINGVAITMREECVEIAGPGWRIYRTDAHTLTVTLDDYGDEPPER